MAKGQQGEAGSVMRPESVSTVVGTNKFGASAMKGISVKVVWAALVVLCVAGAVSGCERKTYTYAGIDNPPAVATVNPHATQSAY